MSAQNVVKHLMQQTPFVIFVLTVIAPFDQSVLQVLEKKKKEKKREIFNVLKK